MDRLRSFDSGLNAAIIGASGGIGRALVEKLRACDPKANIAAFARSLPDSLTAADQVAKLNFETESSIAVAAGSIRTPLDLVIVATGVLHDQNGLRPEKSWGELDPDMLRRSFEINSIGPALVAKHFLPKLARNRKAVFAALSARVGSISDNRLGGWYSYRSSKAALNMLVRTLAIELKRKNPSAICVALHPGTVRTVLSEPFLRGRSGRKSFHPKEAATHLLRSIDGLGPDDSGRLVAWDGGPIPY